MRPAVLVSRQSELGVRALEGRRIGIVPPAMGSDEPLLDRNTPVAYQTAQAAVMELLSGQVDAVLLPSTTVFASTRDAGLDGRITFIDPPLRNVTRHVALHDSRAELLEPINAAIDALKADGRLKGLRLRHGIDVPPPPPDVLTVGVAEFPPYNIYKDDGTFSGFGVEILIDLARLANFQVAFEPISQVEFGEGPSPTTYDMLPQAGISDGRRERMDFTIPVERFEFTLFARTGDTDGLSDLDSIGTRKVGVQLGNLGARFATAHGNLDVMEFETRNSMLRALVAGDVDVLIYPRNPMEIELTKLGLDDDVATVLPPFRILERAIALRPGLGAIRERLDAVIPGYLLTPEFAARREAYFGTPVFWTRLRIYTALGATAALILGLISYLIWQRQNLIRMEAERNRANFLAERSHSQALQLLVDELEQTNTEQSEFTYAISHDLKSPTNTIKLLSGDLREMIPADAGKEVTGILNDIDVTVGRMTTLIDDVLKYALSVNAPLEREPVDLGDVVNDVLEDMKAEFTALDADVSVGPLPTLRGNRTQLRLLFQNLLSNALKFRAKDRPARIRIESETREDAAIVRVIDNGIGIPQKHFERIFGMFKRLHSQDSYEGTGIGLTLCKRIALNHNGIISVSSEMDNGSTFEIKFGLGQNV